jgi:hypothetical protein
MNYLKPIGIAAYLLILVACTQNQKNQQKQTDSLKAGNDSLKTTTKLTKDTTAVDTIAKNNIPKGEDKKAGKHPITLQWISWDKPGSAEIKPLTGDWYSINGSQRTNDGDYLTIDGKIRRISEKELEFEGTIVTKVKYNNNGEACVKKGKQKFYAKGNRKYFRLQNMQNCEGGMLVDYVDIYAGTSSL